MTRSLLAGAMLLSLVVGCGDSNPPTEPVSGVVTLDGKPVEGAMITFKTGDPTEGKSAVGISGADGKYTLTTFSAGDGAVAGSYTISVSKYNTPDGGANPYGDAAEPPPAADPNKKLTEEEEIALMEQGYTAADATPKKEGASTPKNALPEKYAATTTSGLTYTVVAGENTYNIELTK